MSGKLPLKDMTVQEKLAAMELLWDDLTRYLDSFESPEWHGEALEARRLKIAERKAHFTDWDAAKSAIRANVR